MATSSLNSEASRCIHEILELLIDKNYTAMIEKVIAFTKFIFNNMDLLYSSINENFRNSGVVNLLIESMICFNEQSNRDILRLLSLFLKTNDKLRIDVTQNTDFIQFLLNKLSNREAWANIEKNKYYINILSYLLLSKPTPKVYETNLVRKIVKEIIVENQSDESNWITVLCAIFYASAEINVQTEISFFVENKFDDIITKDILNTFGEIIRNYLLDFKMFYINPSNERNQYLKYSLKAEYTFDQVCQCIIYYAEHCQKVRQNLFQSGLYEMLSNIFLIPHVHRLFLLNAIDIFAIPCLDVSLKERFINEHQVIIDKFKNAQTKESTIVKSALETLFSNFQSNSSTTITSISHQSSQTDIFATLNDFSSKSSSHEFNIWLSFDVKSWFIDHKLEFLMTKLCTLTGRGLRQLKTLMTERNGKFQLIELLTSKLNVDLIEVLELLGALEGFDTKLNEENLPEHLNSE